MQGFYHHSLAKFDLRPLLNEYKVQTRTPPTRMPARVDDAHRFITIESSRCIACHRCVRVCEFNAFSLSYHEQEGGVADITLAINASCVS
ncbi:MAG: 4Fe-4S binding protein [Thermodesulfobacteriota bacterium]